MTKTVATGAADFSAASRYKKGGEVAPYCLCEHETSVELILIEHRGRSRLSDELMDEPFEVPLEYTFAVDCVIFENSIQAGLRGGSLIPTVEDFHPVITHAGNVVAVKINKGNVTDVDDFSVVTLPVTGSTDGVVHLLFDLTHGGVSCDLCSVWQGMGGISTPLVPLSQASHPPAVRDRIVQPLQSGPRRYTYQGQHS